MLLFITWLFLRSFRAVRYYGLAGAAAAGLVSMMISYLFQVRRLKQMTGINLGEYYRSMLPAVLNGLFIVVLWAATHERISPLPAYHILPGVLGCLLAYAFALRSLLRHSRAGEKNTKI